MNNGVNNNDTGVGSTILPTNKRVKIEPPFGKGAIVLTPQNSVGRVLWINDDLSCGVSYLEYANAYNVFNTNELQLLCKGADPPYFEKIIEAKVSRERQVYKEEQREIREFIKNKQKKKRQLSQEEQIAEEMIKQLSPEQIQKILEELK